MRSPLASTRLDQSVPIAPNSLHVPNVLTTNIVPVQRNPGPLVCAMLEVLTTPGQRGATSSLVSVHALAEAQFRQHDGGQRSGSRVEPCRSARMRGLMACSRIQLYAAALSGQRLSIHVRVGH